MNEIIQQEIDNRMTALFPHGAGTAKHIRVQAALGHTAQVAFREGKHYAMMGLMTAENVAAEFGFSERRARALIQNRHERFGVGMRFGKSWLVHRDDLALLKPDEKYRAG